MYEEFARCFITADVFCVSLNFRFNAFVLNRMSQHRKRRTISLQAPFKFFLLAGRGLTSSAAAMCFGFFSSRSAIYTKRKNIYIKTGRRRAFALMCLLQNTSVVIKLMNDLYATDGIYFFGGESEDSW
jgi:hypothetical protein